MRLPAGLPLLPLALLQFWRGNVFLEIIPSSSQVEQPLVFNLWPLIRFVGCLD